MAKQTSRYASVVRKQNAQKVSTIINEIRGIIGALSEGTSNDEVRQLAKAVLDLDAHREMQRRNA